MRFRDTVRRPEWQQEFLARTLEERRAFAAQARQQSQAATRDKAAAIMDVNQAAVLALLQQQGQLTMLHGHTHRPAVHDITLDPAIAGETRARRIVLGDWDKDAWFVEIGDGEIALRQQSFPA